WHHRTRHWTSPSPQPLVPSRLTGGQMLSQGCRRTARPLVVAVAAALLALPASAQERRQPEGGGPPPPIAERTKNLKKIDGFFPLYLDENAGRLFVEIPKLDTEVLYATGLATGLGSNDIGLDRGISTG